MVRRTKRGKYARLQAIATSASWSMSTNRCGFGTDLPNQCWQSDFTHWPLGSGQDAQILLWLDDHSRFPISAT